MRCPKKKKSIQKELFVRIRRRGSCSLSKHGFHERKKKEGRKEHKNGKIKTRQELLVKRRKLFVLNKTSKEKEKRQLLSLGANVLGCSRAFPVCM